MNNSLVVKKLQSEDQKNPPSSRPPVEATAYVKDLDVFVTMMLLKDSPAVLSLGLLSEEWATLMEEKEESPSLFTD